MSRLGTQLKSISEMSELIGLGSLSEILDDAGGVQQTYPKLTANIRAKVRYERTNEAERGTNQEEHLEEIKIWVRYASTTTKSKVVYWNSKYWDIYAIEETPGNRYQVIKARAVVE